MKSTSVLLAILMLVSAATAACASQPAAIQESLEIKTGGGITGPFFALFLSSSGVLSLTAESLPFADTKSGLTTDTFTKQLTSAETLELLTLARDATDFSQGCGLVGHGTSARLWLTFRGHTTEFECDGAPKWPVGPHTRSLLAAINHHLPGKLNVF